MAVKLFEFQSAVRGYHYYMKYWSPSKSQVLDCMHEEDNPYDFFAIKTCEKPTGRTVGHLPMEISRSIKYLLQRGAIVEPKLSSTNSRQSVSPSARRIRDTVQCNHKNAINLDK